MTSTIDPISAPADLPLVIAGRTFRSRLLVGTGKYHTNDEMVATLEASGAEVVTVAVRRVDLDRANDESLLNHIDTDRYFLLANTAGCYSAGEAIRYARLAREAGFNDFVKLEVIGDQETLLPDVEGLLQATRTLASGNNSAEEWYKRATAPLDPTCHCPVAGSQISAVLFTFVS